MIKWALLAIRVLSLVLSILSGNNGLITEVKELVDTCAKALADGQITKEELAGIIKEANDTIQELLK